MPWVDLRAGYRCNNRCRFCDQGDRRDHIADAPLAELLALLNRERAAGADGVWLAGGEITLRPDLPRLVEAARAAGFVRVGIQTNGRILAAAGAADRLRGAGLTDATVALHGAEPTLHDWLVQEPGAFRQATTGLRRLAAAGVATRVTTVLTRSGITEIPALAALAPRLGAEGHRWILTRPDGKAADARRMLVPRLALLREPLIAAVRLAWSLRREAETVGIPLCFLGDVRAVAADRSDAPGVRRRFPDGMDEPALIHRYGPPCVGCPLRSACPGPQASYVDHFGWDEIVAPNLDAPLDSSPATGVRPAWGGAPPRNAPPGGPAAPLDPRRAPVDRVPALAPLPSSGPPTPATGAPAPPPRRGRAPATTLAWVRGWRGGDPVPPGPTRTPDPVLVPVEAACDVGCPGCTTRAAYGDWPTEPDRSLRQRVVRAASEGVRGIVFTGASPWSHPSLPAAVREARRLGFATIEVWGPVEPLATLDAGAADKLAGLTHIRAPRLTGAAFAVGSPSADARFATALERLAALLPGCPVELYTPADTPDVSLYQAAGPRAVWAPCQRLPAPLEHAELPVAPPPSGSR